MDRFWLDSYPEDVAHDVDPDRYRSLTELLEESFRKHADQPFSVCMDRWMSYRELDELSAALGAWLQARGLEPGARVAIMLPNLPQFAVSMAAVLRAGYTCVNVDPLYTARELEHQLRDSGASAIVLLENFAHTLEEVIAQTALRHVVLNSLGDLLGPWRGRWPSFAVRHLGKMVPAFRLPVGAGRSVTPIKAALAQGRGLSLRASGQSLASVAFLQYTGGTTDLSQGAVLTQRNIVAAILQAEAWFAPALKRVVDPRRINCIAALPLHHIFALTLCLLAIRQRSHLTLIPNPRDIGKMDARGHTRIVDRKKDLIIVSGFNVFPNDLEHEISLRPGGVECAAVGAADNRQGEAIKVYVVRNAPLHTEQALARFCHERLAGCKRPKYLEFRDELPKSNVGKILRRELRAAPR